MIYHLTTNERKKTPFRAEILLSWYCFPLRGRSEDEEDEEGGNAVIIPIPRFPFKSNLKKYERTLQECSKFIAEYIYRW